MYLEGAPIFSCHGMHKCLAIYHLKPLFCTLCHIYHQGWVIIWSLEAEESAGERNKGRCSSINSDLVSQHCIVSFHLILYSEPLSSQHTGTYIANLSLYKYELYVALLLVKINSCGAVVGPTIKYLKLLSSGKNMSSLHTVFSILYKQ